MKINRQNLTEDYTACSTADWISDFSKNLEKNADYLDNLKSIMKKRKDFSSIDEKMADIKDRAGFNLIKDVDSGGPTKVASEVNPDNCSCGKNNCQKCNPEIFKSLRMVIDYIKGLTEHRPEVGAQAALAACYEQPGLRLSNLMRQIDNKKFMDLIKKIIGDKSSENYTKDEVKYIPEEFSSEEDGAADLSDYWTHAQTG
jgi:hypothetical protein